jgi:hypothetical protein
MSSEDFEHKMGLGSARRIKFYRGENAQNYVDNGNLQLCYKETESVSPQSNKALLTKLVNFYRQKQSHKAASQIQLDNSEFQREFSDLHATYQEMMNVKNVLNNAYEDLIK